MLIENIHSGSGNETVTTIKADACGYIYIAYMLAAHMLIIKIEVPISSEQNRKQRCC